MQGNQPYSRVTRSLERLNISNIKNVPIRIVQKGQHENNPIISQITEIKEQQATKSTNQRLNTETKSNSHTRTQSIMAQDHLDSKNPILFRSYGEEIKPKTVVTEKYQTAPNQPPENIVRMSYDLSKLKNSENFVDRFNSRRHSEKKYSIDLGTPAFKNFEGLNQDPPKSKPPLKERISINTEVANKVSSESHQPFVTPKFAMLDTRKGIDDKVSKPENKIALPVKINQYDSKEDDLSSQKENIPRFSNIQSNKENILTERRSNSLATNRKIPSLEAINEKLTKNRKLLSDIQSIENQIRNEIQSLDNEISSYVDSNKTSRKILQERRASSIEKEPKPNKSGLYSEVFEDIENKVLELNQRLSTKPVNSSSQFLRGAFKP